MREWLTREKWKKVGETLLAVLATVLILFVLFRFLLPALLPFLLGFLLAALLQKPIAFLKERWHVPPKIASVVLVLAFPALFLLGFSLLFRLLFSEMTEFLASLSSRTAEITEAVALFSEKAEAALRKIVSFFAPGAEPPDITTVFESAALSGIELLTKAVPGLLRRFAGSIPALFFFLIAFFLSAFRFSADYSVAKERLLSLLPPALKKRLFPLRARGKGTLLSLVRAYGALFLLTFAELLIGFILLRVPYALLLALGTAIVDILPVLGTGTVLLPWALVLFLSGNVGKGAALLLLYLAVTIVRQILEPRLVGKEIGLPPLASLMGMYAGWKLLGVMGMLLCPLGLALLFRLFPAFPGTADREKTGA